MEQITQEKLESTGTLNGVDRTAFAGWLVAMHRKLHDNRGPQVALAKQIETWRSINQDVPTYKDLDGKRIDGFRDAKFSTMCFIDKAQVGNQSWTDIDQMYDIKLADPQVDTDTAIQQTEAQKYALNKAMKDCNIELQYDKAYEYFQQWGELISCVGWKQLTVTKTVSSLASLTGQKEISIQEDNANMTAIDPMFFEFDTASFKKDNKENWDSIIKIHKRFETVDKILNAKYYDGVTGKTYPLYTLKKEEAETLRNNNTKIEDAKRDSELATNTCYGNSYEVLFLHGDFTFNGKEYKNYIAEVYAGRYLIRFCKNPYHINPFVIEIPDVDPVTKRGIAKMKSIIYTSIQRQHEINRSFKISRLNTNPPVIASKQCLDDLLNGKNADTIEWEAGVTIPVDDFSNMEQMKPVTFNNNYSETNVAFVTNEIADNGGINANAMGNVEKQERKATDLNLAKAGQDTRLSQTLDSVYKFIIKNVEAIADLLALFKYGNEFIRVFDKKQQKERIIEITDFIRQAHYTYEYKDRNALNAQKTQMENLYPLLEKAVQAGFLDGRETLKLLLETYGFDNIDRIFKQPSPLEQMAQQMPPEMQEQVVQMIQGMMQQQQQQQDMQELQQRVDKNAVRKVMQQQADIDLQQQMAQQNGQPMVM